MKRETPTERDIMDLIASAYEKLAEPDPRRLAAIEERLLDQSRWRGRRKTVWWWLVGALVAGAAGALWWVVDYDTGKGQNGLKPGVMAPSVVPPAQEQPARPSRSEGVESKPAGAPAQKPGSVIYQRER